MHSALKLWLLLMNCRVGWAVSMAGKGHESKQLKLEGNITIGGLFPMHEDGSSEGKHCGKIKEDKGIQRMEAMLYAVKKINEEKLLLPDLQLGVDILDTCSQDTHALEQSLEFIKTAISTDNANQYECRDRSTPIYKRPNPTVGVIGAASSQVSAMVANMLRLFKVCVCVSVCYKYVYW